MRVARTTGKALRVDAKMSWLVPSEVVGWLGNRHHLERGRRSSTRLLSVIGSIPVGKASPSLESLTVIIGGQPVGTGTVVEQQPRKVFGLFVADPGFGPYRPVFEAAVELARQFNANPMTEPCDYAMWDRLMDAYAEINNLGPTCAEAASAIEEFAVHADWAVEVTFEGPSA
jgi:hypothetical protein